MCSRPREDRSQPPVAIRRGVSADRLGEPRDVSRSPKARIEVPRGGIEPPTRGISVPGSIWMTLQRALASDQEHLRREGYGRQIAGPSPRVLRIPRLTRGLLLFPAELLEVLVADEAETRSLGTVLTPFHSAPHFELPAAMTATNLAEGPKWHSRDPASTRCGWSASISSARS